VVAGFLVVVVLLVVFVAVVEGSEVVAVNNVKQLQMTNKEDRNIC